MSQFVFSGKDIGNVQNIFQNNIIYLGTSFAPGIWAGCEGLQIKINNKPFVVIEVLFSQKALKLNTSEGISINDTISCDGNFIIVDSR